MKWLFREIGPEEWKWFWIGIAIGFLSGGLDMWIVMGGADHRQRDPTLPPVRMGEARPMTRDDVICDAPNNMITIKPGIYDYEKAVTLCGFWDHGTIKMFEPGETSGRVGK